MNYISELLLFSSNLYSFLIIKFRVLKYINVSFLYNNAYWFNIYDVTLHNIPDESSQQSQNKFTKSSTDCKFTKKQ